MRQKDGEFEVGLKQEMLSKNQNQTVGSKLLGGFNCE
jgi:hypothetical protein